MSVVNFILQILREINCACVFWHELGLHCSDFVFIYFSVRTASEIRTWVGNDIPIVLHENNNLSLNGPAGRRQLSITMFAVAVEYCRQRSNKCLWCSLLNQFPQGFYSVCSFIKTWLKCLISHSYLGKGHHNLNWGITYPLWWRRDFAEFWYFAISAWQNYFELIRDR